MTDLTTLEQRVTELERLTTGEDGYMLISVPIGSYVLPPKEVNKQIKLKLKDEKLAEKMFTKEDMIEFAAYCDTSWREIHEYKELLPKWKNEYKVIQ